MEEEQIKPTTEPIFDSSQTPDSPLPEPEADIIVDAIQNEPNPP
jgi:hypothetical protein